MVALVAQSEHELRSKWEQFYTRCELIVNIKHATSPKIATIDLGVMQNGFLRFIYTKIAHWCLYYADYHQGTIGVLDKGDLMGYAGASL